MKKNTFLILLFLCSIKVTAQNIGIGTLTPTKKLQVVGNLFVRDSLGIAVKNPLYKLDVGGRMRLYSGGSADNTAGFWLNKKSNTAFGAFVGMESNNVIGIYSPITSWSMGMNTDNGNVGFGNVNPIYKLDVTGKIRIRSGGSENSTAGFWLNNTTNNSPAAFTGMYSDDRMGIFSEAIQNWPIMINVNTGNVGIGNNNPVEKLEVTGDVNASGIIAAAGNFVVGLEYRVVNFDVADNSSPTVDCNCPLVKQPLAVAAGIKMQILGKQLYPSYHLFLRKMVVVGVLNLRIEEQILLQVPKPAKYGPFVPKCDKKKLINFTKINFNETKIITIFGGSIAIFCQCKQPKHCTICVKCSRWQLRQYIFLRPL